MSKIHWITIETCNKNLPRWSIKWSHHLEIACDAQTHSDAIFDGKKSKSKSKSISKYNNFVDLKSLWMEFKLDSKIQQIYLVPLDKT